MILGESARFPSIRPAARLRDLLPLLAVFVALAGAGALIPLLDRPLLVLASIAAVGALALIARRIDLGVYALIAATALNRYNFAVAGWNAKVENIVLLAVLAALAWRIASRRERAQPLPLVFLFGSLLAVNVLSSLLNSADLYKSFRIIVRMALAVTTMYVISTYVSDRARLLGAIRALLTVGAAASAFAIVALVLWHYLGQDFGVQRDPVSGAMSVKGTLWEGNILGSYVAGIATLSGGLLLSHTRTFDRRFLTVVFALSAVALVLSLTRGAWLGFAAGALLTVLLLRGARLPVVMLVAGLAVFAGALVLRFDLGGTSDDVTARFATLSAMPTDPTALSRLKYVDQGFAEWRESPLLGWGTDGFHINHPKIMSALPTPELDALYDTGVIGLALFATVFGALLFRCAATASRRADEGLTTLLGALTIAAVAQLVAFQATDALWLGFIWIYFGLMLAAVRLIDEGAPRSNAQLR